MAQDQPRRLALRVIGVIFAALACSFGWLAILTFDVADWPAHSVWPQTRPPGNWCGSVGAWLAYQAFFYLGLGVYPVALLLTAAVFVWAQAARLPHVWMRGIGVLLACAAVSSAAAMFLPASDRWPITGAGGVLGAAAAEYLRANLQTPGALVLLAASLVVGLILAVDEAVLALGRWLVAAERPSEAAAPAGNLTATATIASGPRHFERSQPPPTRIHRADLSSLPAGGPEGVARPDARSTQFKLPLSSADDDGQAARGGEGARDDARSASPATEPKRRASSDAALRVTDIGAGAPRLKSPPAAPPQPQAGDYLLPPLTLLEHPEPLDREAVEYLCREKAYLLEQTLNEFRLEVQVVAIETGPVITVFELRLAPGIKVSQIAALTNDMARALKAPAVRVVAPLPNKNTIGIEVPNVDKEKVRLRDLMLAEAAGPRANSHAIPLYLGKDASGQPLVSDLTHMPHLLIAGTTGSGKSVCIASLITSILVSRTPQEVSLILVDPKVVELAAFKDIPHLMCPIVTETPKAEGILDWAATKMDERYALLAEAAVKDIVSYNRLGERELRRRMGIESDDEMARVPLKLPYIVIVVDELADLMMTSASDVEFFLCRLAQKSRAVGIHLIVSTQRPQANVVTGLIKSNLPCRISFRVSSRLDSRIVLDQNGGESLMGQGDMLFLPPGSSKLIRAQGTYVSDEELKRVVSHVKSQAEPNYHPELTRLSKSGETSGERDELFDQAVDIILETGRGSVSLLQRRLMVGYGRASRLIDQMYEAGIVGEYKGSQAREIVMTRDEWDALKAQRDREEAAEAAAGSSKSS